MVSVGTLTDSDIKELCSKGILIRENFCEANVNQACYELRASNIYYDLASGKRKYTLKDDEFILIKPKQLVVIITKESMELPDNILGRILTKGKLFSIGLLPVNTYADPGFSGKLGIVFFNASNNYIKITQSSSVAKIEFSKLEKPVERTYQGQHGYNTEIWPIPEDLVMTIDEINKEERILDPASEIKLSYGENVANVIERVFKFERYLLLAALSYFLLFLILIAALSGTDWITPVVSLLIGVISNIITSFIIIFATNLKRRP